MASEDRFGYEWGKYFKILPQYESQFNNWIYPLNKEDLKNKDILDAGCGMGRNSFYALQYGANSVTGIDNDEISVNAARANLIQYKNSEILQRSIYEVEFKNKFDLIFSIGVIHHLENPNFAIKKLIDALQPNGVILIWVYSYEGNEWIKKFVSPIRNNITSKLPIEFLHFLTYFISIPFYLILKLINPSTRYYKQIAKFSFKHLHSIIFDQLLPEIANYWTKEEALSLLNNEKLTDISINHPPNGMGWTVVGRKR